MPKIKYAFFLTCANISVYIFFELLCLYRIEENVLIQTRNHKDLLLCFTLYTWYKPIYVIRQNANYEQQKKEGNDAPPPGQILGGKRQF